MINFDWVKFCRQYKIPFVTSGPNTGRDHISIQCPWCGERDHSQHLGISTIVNTPYWGCLRSPEHRGYNPRKLIQRLLQCSYEQALSIIKTHNLSNPDEFDALLSKNKETLRVEPAPEELKIPKEFRSIVSTPPSKYAKQFLNYIADTRGFGADAEAVCKKYSLFYALTGEQAWRIIIPTYNTNGKLWSWTGRAIHPSAELRYKVAVGSGKGMLFNEDQIRSLSYRPRALFVVEGPLDCMKVDFYGAKFNCAAVAVLGTSVTEEQIARIALLGTHVDKIVLLMDPEALDVNLILGSALTGISRAPVVEGYLPEGVEDPGALSKAQVELLCKKYCTQPIKALL